MVCSLLMIIWELQWDDHSTSEVILLFRSTIFFGGTIHFVKYEQVYMIMYMHIYAEIIA